MKPKMSLDKFEIAKLKSGEKKGDIAKYYLDLTLAEHIAQYSSIEAFKLFHEKSKLGKEEIITVPPTFEEYGVSGRDFNKVGVFINVSSFIGAIVGLFLFAYCGYLIDSSWRTGIIASIVGPGALFAFPVSAIFRSFYETFSSRVKKCSKYCQAVRNFSKTKVEFWQRLSWKDFEKEVSKVFEREGFVSRVTKATGDKGVDIILHHNNHKIIVQCKQYNKAVGPALVRELIGAVYSQNAAFGILVALTGYTQGSYDAANEGPILLWDIEDLMGLKKENIERIFANKTG